MKNTSFEGKDTAIILVCKILLKAQPSQTYTSTSHSMVKLHKPLSNQKLSGSLKEIGELAKSINIQNEYNLI